MCPNPIRIIVYREPNNMICDQAVFNASLSLLTNESRKLLSALLNTKKVLTHMGPDKITRQRDWRGIASLANISNELKLSIDAQCTDKIGKVLELWIDMSNNTATVLHLLKYLEMIDRFDVRDDLLDLANQEILIEDTDCDIITFEDKKFRTPQYYHAYVLYAQEDRDFFDQLNTYMTNEGYRLCSEDNLLPGHATRYEPLSRLMLMRCRHIILIYSPDFLRTPAITFFMNLAQADGITNRKLKIIPVMYRECVLPEHLRFYHNLRYNRPEDKAPFDFWKKLIDTLGSVDLPICRRNSRYSSQSELLISDTNNELYNGYTSVKQLPVNGLSSNRLALPSVPRVTVSMGDIRDIDLSSETQSLNLTSEGSKKKAIRKFLTKAFRKEKPDKQKEHKKGIAMKN